MRAGDHIQVLCLNALGFIDTIVKDTFSQSNKSKADVTAWTLNKAKKCERSDGDGLSLFNGTIIYITFRKCNGFRDVRSRFYETSTPILLQNYRILLQSCSCLCQKSKLQLLFSLLLLRVFLQTLQITITILSKL